MNQRTINKETAFSGKALQTGADVSVVCKPLGTGEGIVFVRTDSPSSVSVTGREGVFSSEGERRTTVGTGGSSVQTVEHLMAALWALGIDNIRVEVFGEELPALDGSAKGFMEALRKGGIKEQNAPREAIRITGKEEVREGNASITLMPHDGFRVSYAIDYPVRSIKKETFAMELDSASFEREIAGARTFCLKHEAEMLMKAGLGKGADFENTLVMDEEGPIGTTLKFRNEPVRHKILDLVGDLYLLGRPLICEVSAERSGHALNGKMVKLIYDKYVKKTKDDIE
ncbi:MAG: UDP-3-O-acyl-N-acetylglucosamine deacetylase [Candidatus Omnitrophota bacterium]|nr:UDP-3-O-acyl-N-acetylglucosamine deacetylase [Candidatus Omnitrophota bacterium]